MLSAVHSIVRSKRCASRSVDSAEEDPPDAAVASRSKRRRVRARAPAVAAAAAAPTSAAVPIDRSSSVPYAPRSHPPLSLSTTLGTEHRSTSATFLPSMLAPSTAALPPAAAAAVTGTVKIDSVNSPQLKRDSTSMHNGEEAGDERSDPECAAAAAPSLLCRSASSAGAASVAAAASAGSSASSSTPAPARIGYSPPYREPSRSERQPTTKEIQAWLKASRQHAHANLHRMRRAHRQRRSTAAAAAATGSSSALDCSSATATLSGLPKRHPLLGSPPLHTFAGLAALYAAHPMGHRGVDVQIYIDEVLSRMDLHAPIQFTIRAQRNIKKGNPVSHYGGLPLPSPLIKEVGERMKLSSPCSHARSINNQECALDGLPFAWMLRRPIPHTEEELQRLIAVGVEALMPQLSHGFTSSELQAFRASPVGYLANSPQIGQQSNVCIAWISLNGLCEIPYLKATRDITKGDDILCPYNSEESRKVRQAQRAAAACKPGKLTAAGRRALASSATAAASPATHRGPTIRSPHAALQERKRALIAPINEKLRASRKLTEEELALTEGAQSDEDSAAAAGAAAAPSSKAAAAAFSSSSPMLDVESIECDVCRSTDDSDPTNPIILCSAFRRGSGCPNGRHRNCWSGPVPALEIVTRPYFQHTCYEHMPFRTSRGCILKREREAAAAAAQAGLYTPRHNVPSLHLPLLSETRRTRAAGAVNALMQCYVVAESWQLGLQWNCDALGVAVQTSSLRLRKQQLSAHSAGLGLVARRDFPPESTVGWFWGKFVSKQDWQAMVNGGPDTSRPIFAITPAAAAAAAAAGPGVTAAAAAAAEETFAADAARGNWCCLDPGTLDDAHTSYQLLISRQCPLAYVNDPHNTGRAVNVRLAPVPESAMMPPDSQGAMDWRLFPVVTTAHVNKGDEFLIDYGWKKADWATVRRLSNQWKRRQAATAAAASSSSASSDQLSFDAASASSASSANSLFSPAELHRLSHRLPLVSSPPRCPSTPDSDPAASPFTAEMWIEAAQDSLLEARHRTAVERAHEEKLDQQVAEELEWHNEDHAEEHLADQAAQAEEASLEVQDFNAEEQARENAEDQHLDHQREVEEEEFGWNYQDQAEEHLADQAAAAAALQSEQMEISVEDASPPAAPLVGVELNPGPAASASSSSSSSSSDVNSRKRPRSSTPGSAAPSPTGGIQSLSDFFLHRIIDFLPTSSIVCDVAPLSRGFHSACLSYATIVGQMAAPRRNLQIQLAVLKKSTLAQAAEQSSFAPPIAAATGDEIQKYSHPVQLLLQSGRTALGNPQLTLRELAEHTAQQLIALHQQPSPNAQELSRLSNELEHIDAQEAQILSGQPYNMGLLPDSWCDCPPGVNPARPNFTAAELAAQRNEPRGAFNVPCYHYMQSTYRVDAWLHFHNRSQWQVSARLAAAEHAAGLPLAQWLPIRDFQWEDVLQHHATITRYFCVERAAAMLAASLIQSPERLGLRLGVDAALLRRLRAHQVGSTDRQVKLQRMVTCRLRLIACSELQALADGYKAREGDPESTWPTGSAEARLIVVLTPMQAEYRKWGATAISESRQMAENPLVVSVYDRPFDYPSTSMH